MFWWASVCQICKQKICSKCMRKVSDMFIYYAVLNFAIQPPFNLLLDTYANWRIFAYSSLHAQSYFEFSKRGESEEFWTKVCIAIKFRYFKVFNKKKFFSLSINPSSITLREQKGSLHNSQMLRQQYSTAGSSADRSRKMDACEECCDLITRIIQTNSLAAMQQSILPNAHESSTSTSRRAPAPLLSSYFRGIPRSSTTVGCTSGLLSQSSAVSSGCPPSRKISKDYNPALNS